MRKCPACGYGNAAASPRCGVCGRDLAGVPSAAPPPAPRRELYLMPALGLLLLLCAAFFWLYQNFPGRGEPQPAAGGTAASDEAYFSYDGAVSSLERMKDLRFLPREDKLRAARLLFAGDGLAAVSAARALGSWARSDDAPGDRNAWLELLLKGAAEAEPAARREAALEAAYALGGGLDPAPHAERARAAAGGLISSGEAGRVQAGYLLAAMAGVEDFSAQMERTLSYDPSGQARLYAACALARLGRPAAHAYLAGLAEGADPDLRSGAMDCLLYSSAPQTVPYLSSLARGRGELAASAKRTLMLREQLAIIKK